MNFLKNLKTAISYNRTLIWLWGSVLYVQMFLKHVVSENDPLLVSFLKALILIMIVAVLNYITFFILLGFVLLMYRIITGDPEKVSNLVSRMQPRRYRGRDPNSEELQ